MKEEIKKEIPPITKVIYKISGDVTAGQICPVAVGLTPPQRAFLNYTSDNALNNKLCQLLQQNPSIAIVCDGTFGSGPTNTDAIPALQGYSNLTIIATTIDPTFFTSCNVDPTLQKRLIQCPTISADNVNVDDEIEIQTNKLIQKRLITLHNFNTTTVTSSESSEGDEEPQEE